MPAPLMSTGSSVNGSMHHWWSGRPQPGGWGHSSSVTRPRVLGHPSGSYAPRVVPPQNELSRDGPTARAQQAFGRPAQNDRVRDPADLDSGWAYLHGAR
jgi:hypothetical protein